MQLPILCVLVISCWLHARLMGGLFNNGNYIVLRRLCIVRVGAGQFCQELSIKTFLKCNEVKHLDRFQGRTTELRYTFKGDNLLSGYRNAWHPGWWEGACHSVLGLSMAHPELIPEPQSGVEARGKHLSIVEKCLLHKKQQFKPIPGLFMYSWDGIWFLNFFKYKCMKHTLRSRKKSDLLQFPSKDPMYKNRPCLLTTKPKCNVLVCLLFSFVLDCSLFQSFDFQMTC